MQLGLQRGILKIWKDDRGFGFITPKDGGDDIFVHISEFKGLTRRPQTGDLVGYDTVIQNDKRRACNAFIVGSQPQRLSARAVITSSRLSRFPWEVVPITAFPLGCAIYWAWTHQSPLLYAVYPVMSLLTFTVYANDKLKAQTHQWRVPEATLHLLELAGGWPGGFIAQQKLRHKTQKASYQATFWAIVGLHYVGWLSWLVLS